MKYLFIDIRKSDEVYQKRFGESNQYDVYNIPMDMIRFNNKTLSAHLEYFKEIYIVCHSSRRASFIKNKYFLNYPNIKVHSDLQFVNLHLGINNIKLNDDIVNVNIVGNNAFNLYSIMRITQVVLGSLILTLAGYTYYEIKNKKINTIPIIILLLFGLMALINGLTSTCTLSDVLINYLN